MDRSELIKKFIKENLDILLSEQFDDHLYKYTKRKFFIEKFKAKGGSPRDREIAKNLLEHLIRYNAIKTAEELSQNLETPYLKKNIYDSKPFYSLIEAKLQILSPQIDITKLKDNKYMQQLEESIREQIKEEFIETETSKAREEAEKEKERINKKIKERLEEYNSLPSVLDESDLPEPAVTIEDDVGSFDFEPWWRKLYLRENPFPTQEGLNQIDKGLFEAIVIKTSIFKRFLYWTRKEKQQLFRNSILFGEYGTGKTTLYDYLKKHFQGENILPLYILLKEERDYHTLYYEFHKRLFKELCTYYKTIKRDDPVRWLESQPNEEANLTLFKELHDEEYSFIIIIDDLHKIRDNLDIPMKFVSNIQILTAQISREVKNIQLSFIVSGIMDWKHIIETDQKFSGSYIKNHEMPPITDSIALEMLNKRLKAYSINKQKTVDIDQAFVKQIYRELERKNQPITYRNFIKAVEEEFERGNFSILTTKPVTITDELLVKIKNMLESYVDLKKAFNKLIYGGGIKKKENIHKTLSLLIKVYIKRGINERSPEFQEDLFYYKRLAEVNLIQKVKLSKKKFKWNVNKRLFNANKRILKEYKCSMEDYLLHIYSHPSRMKALEGPKESSVRQIQQFQDFINTIPRDYSTLKEYLQKSLNLHEAILEIKDSPEHGKLPKTLPDKLFPSITFLMKAIAHFQNMPIDSFEFEELRDCCRNYWYQISEVTEFFNLLHESHKIEEQLWHILSMYEDAFMNLFLHLKDIYNKSVILQLDINDLNNHEIQLFDETRNQWFKMEKFKLIKKLTDFMEIKFRKTFFNLFHLMYGEKWRRRLDKASNKYIDECKEKDKSRNKPLIINELHYLNRGHWRNFLTGIRGSRHGTHNWNKILKYIFPTLSQKDFDNFLGDFATYNLDASHNKTEILRKLDQSKIHSFISSCLEITKAFNRVYENLIKSCLYRAEIESNEFDKFYFCFSMDNNNDSRYLSPIKVDLNEINKLINLFKAEEDLSIDFEDSKMIKEVYNVSYTNFMVICSLLLNEKIWNKIINLEARFIFKRRIGTFSQVSLEEI